MTRSTHVGRGRLRARRALLIVTTILTSCGAAAPALAQDQPYRQVDDNGIDLATGEIIMAFKEASVGSGRAELAIIRRNGSDRDSSQFDGITFLRNGTGGGNTIVIGRGDRIFDAFDKVGGQFVARKRDGATISGAGDDYTYTATDGTTIRFTNPVGGTELCRLDATQSYCALLPLTITSPDGAVVTMSYEASIYTPFDPSDPNPPAQAAWRLRGVANSYGYSFDYAFASDTTYPDAPPPDAWHVRTGAMLRNSGSAVSSVGYAYPFSGYADVTDPTGNTWRVSDVTLRRPGETSNSYVASAYSASALTVTKDGIVTNYARNVSGTTATMTVTNALSQNTTIVSDLTTGRPTTVTDALGKTTTYSYDAYGRLTRMTAPEGNYVSYTLDARGNATETRAVGKPGSGVADIVTYASYPATCGNAKTCNKPTSATDARGGVTDYSYDSTHGGVLTVQRPAATLGAARPTTTYGYTQVGGEYLPTTISTCAVAASCAGTAGEVKSTATWDGAGNMTSVTTAAGDGSLTATTGYGYTAAGDLGAADGPLAGTADTTTYLYDAARRPIGVIGPDPDGAGVIERRAQRIVYDTAGRVTSSGVGSAQVVAPLTGSNFTAIDEVVSTWAGDRKLSDWATGRGVVQYGYDAAGRATCTVQRMNLSPLSSQPADACTLGTPGSNGPDRLTRTFYDAVGRVSQVQSAYGTSDQSTDASASYGDNGRLATLTDANGNRTTYARDGHDRLSRTYYPVTTPGAYTSSATDYEELGYDPSGNVTNRTLRGGGSIGYAYDALDRLTSKDLPGSEPDVTYTYDLLGRMIEARQPSQAVGFGYDALGRQVSESGPLGTLVRTFDQSGARTRLTWPDGHQIDYQRLADGGLEYIRENGATSGPGVLAWLRYEPGGRLARIDRGNATVQTTGHLSYGQLSDHSENLGGTIHDVSWLFNGYTPAGEIAQVNRTNDLYAWPGHATGSQATAINGLNQATSLGHDARGNVTAIGSSGYGYSSENLLTTAPGATLAYDPLGRLASIATSAGTTRFQYDGLDMVAEYEASGTMQRRYVHGDGIDQPIVWYEGATLSDRRWLHTDERGSVVAMSDGVGNAHGINRYDEYGVPASGNLGRFGYTGQMWLGEIGLSYYKARMYAPQLGRFLQPDPIGYGDGMNLYGYVGGDPINFTDPSGLEVCGIGQVEQINWSTDNRPLGPDEVRATYTVKCLPDLNRWTDQPGGPLLPGGNGGPAAPTPRNEKSLLDRAKSLYCSLPALGISASARGYDILGGGIAWDLAFDPQSGRLGFSAGIDVGVGVGGSVNLSQGSNATAGRSVANGWSGSVGVNANARLGPIAAGASTTLIGRSGPGFGGVSAGLRPGGTGATVNANLGVRGGYGGKVAPACGR